MTDNGEYEWGSDELFGHRPGPWRGKLERAFWEFHYKNPVVYRFLVRYAREWKNAGHQTCSIQLLFERARWQIMIAPDQDGLKLNNNHCAFYSRLIEELEPDLKDFFRKRQQRIQSTIGPDNEDLPPGDHIS